ncbi:MAG: hypothetical protein ACE5IO_10185 [Thermoplasmata archaeon]
MKKMRWKVKELEERKGIKVKCPTVRFRCRYCPAAALSWCGKLERYLETGDWE